MSEKLYTLTRVIGQAATFDVFFRGIKLGQISGFMEASADGTDVVTKWTPPSHKPGSCPRDAAMFLIQSQPQRYVAPELFVQNIQMDGVTYKVFEDWRNNACFNVFRLSDGYCMGQLERRVDYHADYWYWRVPETGWEKCDFSNKVCRNIEAALREMLVYRDKKPRGARLY